MNIILNGNHAKIIEYLVRYEYRPRTGSQDTGAGRASVADSVPSDLDVIILMTRGSDLWERIPWESDDENALQTIFGCARKLLGPIMTRDGIMTRWMDF